MESRKKKRLIRLTLILIPFLIYIKTVSYEFVWDDISNHLVENEYLEEITFKNLLHFWTTPYRGMYIPLAYNIWGLVKPLGAVFSNGDNGFNPAAYHLISVMTHIINGLLVFAFLKKLIKKDIAVLIGALLFLLHPIQVESVAWVSEFRGLLSATLGISSLLLYVKSLETEENSLKYCLPAIILFALSMLSKPSGIVMVLIMGLISHSFNKLTFRQMSGKLIIFLLVTAPIILITGSIQSNTKFISLPHRFLLWMDTINFYLYKIMFPESLAISYSRNVDEILDSGTLNFEWIIPTLIVIGLWFIRKKNKPLIIAFLIFLIGFLPVSNLIPFYFQRISTVADRYLYISMIGIALGMAFLADRYGKKALVTAAIIVIIAGTRTFFHQIPIWKDPVSVWGNCVEVTPEEHIAYNLRGSAYRKRGEFEKAIADFSKAIEITPDFSRAYYNRGLIYFEKKDYRKAIQDHNKVLELNHDYYNLYNNRGIELMKKGMNRRALEIFNKIINLKPDFPNVYYNRAMVFYRVGKYKRALDDIVMTEKLRPGLVDPEFMTAVRKKLDKR